MTADELSELCDNIMISFDDVFGYSNDFVIYLLHSSAPRYKLKNLIKVLLEIQSIK